MFLHACIAHNRSYTQTHRDQPASRKAFRMPSHSPPRLERKLAEISLFFEIRIMRTGVMNVLGRNVHGLCYVDVKLEFIRKSLDCPRLANAIDGINHKVLVGLTMDPNKDVVTLSNALAGNSTFSGSSLVAQSLPEEW